MSRQIPRLINAGLALGLLVTMSVSISVAAMAFTVIPDKRVTLWRFGIVMLLFVGIRYFLGTLRRKPK